jgi:hypothetical protein
VFWGWGGAHADHVHGLLQVLEPLLVLDAEALLFIHDHQAQIAELDVLRQQAVGADGDIDLAFARSTTDALSSLGERNRLNISVRTGKGWKAAFEGLEMLKCENCSRSQDRHLLAVAEALKVARITTSVLPKPTSPQSRRSMG